MHTIHDTPTTRQRGFSLIELMIVVAIVGILAAIGYPSYRDSVRKANRTEGKALLVDAANRQERFYSNNNSYTANMTQLNYAANPAISESQYYSVAAVALPVASGGTGNIATSFLLSATAQGGQADDTQCAVISIDNLGQKTAVASGGGDTSTICW